MKPKRLRKGMRVRIRTPSKPFPYSGTLVKRDPQDGTWLVQWDPQGPHKNQHRPTWERRSFLLAHGRFE